jgi:hypothetical protein
LWKNESQSGKTIEILYSQTQKILPEGLIFGIFGLILQEAADAGRLGGSAKGDPWESGESKSPLKTKAAA